MVFRAPTPQPGQANLPGTTSPEESAPEGVKYETTAKGPRWTIRVHRASCLDDAGMVRRIVEIDRAMRAEFGEPT